jgi:hypothetical protein
LEYNPKTLAFLSCLLVLRKYLLLKFNNEPSKLVRSLFRLSIRKPKKKNSTGSGKKICCEKHHYRPAGKSFADSSQRKIICQLLPNSSFFYVHAIAISVCSRAMFCFAWRLSTCQKFGLFGT